MNMSSTETAAVILFSNSPFIDKSYPKFDRLINDLNEVSFLVPVLDLQLPFGDEYKLTIYLDLFAIRIVDTRSFRAGNRVNSFIATISNFDVLRCSRNFTTDSKLPIHLSEFASESPAIITIYLKSHFPISFKLLALRWRHVRPYPIRKMPRGHSGIECTKVEFCWICRFLFGGSLKSALLPFEFFQKVTKGFKSVCRWLACSFHQFLSSSQNTFWGFWVNFPFSEIGSVQSAAPSEAPEGGES